MDKKMLTGAEWLRTKAVEFAMVQSMKNVGEAKIPVEDRFYITKIMIEEKYGENHAKALDKLLPCSAKVQKNGRTWMYSIHVSKANEKFVLREPYIDSDYDVYNEEQELAFADAADSDKDSVF